MIPRILEHLDQARQQFTWRELCHELLPCATVLRWRARSLTGQVLIQRAGPKKCEPLNAQVLQCALQQLHHGRRRTARTTDLYTRFSNRLSRRRLQQLVAKERINQNKAIKRIEWLVPGVAWSIDTTEYGVDKLKITPLRDLASKYQMPTPLVAPAEEGERIASYLEQTFLQQGAPMFLKRDGGSPLNCSQVNDVLQRYAVLPLNSPPGYPQYNGSIERSMRDLHQVLDQRQQVVSSAPISLELELATDQLNHRSLRSLKGCTPCQVFHDPARRLHLHGSSRQRIFREVVLQFWQCLECMPERNPHTTHAAWRLVVESWLRRQGWIAVSVNNQNYVSTDSEPFCSQN